MKILFFLENRIWYFMQIVSTICLKCQNLFSGENKKYIFQYVTSVAQSDTHSTGDQVACLIPTGWAVVSYWQKNVHKYWLTA